MWAGLGRHGQGKITPAGSRAAPLVGPKICTTWLGARLVCAGLGCDRVYAIVSATYRTPQMGLTQLDALTDAGQSADPFLNSFSAHADGERRGLDRVPSERSG